MYFETILNIAKAIKSKALTPVEITEAMLARINEIDSYSSAYITVTTEHALAQAKKSEAEIVAGQWRGLLNGVPIGLKDIINTDFAKTTAGTEIHRNYHPTYSATVVERLETQGAISLGKLTTTEQAFSDHHPSVTVPRNPRGEGSPAAALPRVSVWRPQMVWLSVLWGRTQVVRFVRPTVLPA